MGHSLLVLATKSLVLLQLWETDGLKISPVRLIGVIQGAQSSWCGWRRGSNTDHSPWVSKMRAPVWLLLPPAKSLEPFPGTGHPAKVGGVWSCGRHSMKELILQPKL